jgi:hypothetical protein
MMKTLKEMKIGSEPDETADYWEERERIDQWIGDLDKVNADIDGSFKNFNRKRADIDIIEKEAELNS